MDLFVLRRRCLSLSLVPLDPESFVCVPEGSLVPVRSQSSRFPFFRARVHPSGAPSASLVPSGRQRPHSPGRLHIGPRSVRSVGAGLTTRSSERPLHVRPFCLALPGAVAELGGVRRHSSSSMTAPFVQTGSLRVGDSYWRSWDTSWPSARLTVSETAIDISVSFFFSSRRYTFTTASVRRLSVYRGFFSRGLRIEHTAAEHPPFFVFWTFGLRALTLALAQRGFQVELPGTAVPPSGRVV